MRDDHQHEAARDAEQQAQDAVDGADPAVEHGVGDARRDQVNDDQHDQEDDPADGDLGHQHGRVELLGDLLAPRPVYLKTK